MTVEDLVGDVLEHQPVGAAVRGVIVAGGPELVVPVVDGDADHVDAPFPGGQHGLVGPVGKDDVARPHLVEVLFGPQRGGMGLHDAGTAAAVVFLLVVGHVPQIHGGPNFAPLPDDAGGAGGQIADLIQFPALSAQDVQRALVVLLHEQHGVAEGIFLLPATIALTGVSGRGGFQPAPGGGGATQQGACLNHFPAIELGHDCLSIGGREKRRDLGERGLTTTRKRHRHPAMLGLRLSYNTRPKIRHGSFREAKLQRHRRRRRSLPHQPSRVSLAGANPRRRTRSRHLARLVRTPHRTSLRHSARACATRPSRAQRFECYMEGQDAPDYAASGVGCPCGNPAPIVAESTLQHSPL